MLAILSKFGLSASQGPVHRHAARTFLALSLAGAIALSVPSGAARAAEGVVAKVGNVEITENMLALAAADLEQQFAQVPEDKRKAAILSALIDIVSLSAKAEEEGLGDDPVFKERMEFLKMRALHNQYFQDKIAESISDEELKARFDQEVKAITPEKQIKARHILVKTEEEAREIIKELEGGADFTALAKEKSTGPSGPNGGDLGFFSAGQMVPEFSKAAFDLKNGEFTKEPVQTQFGWHVILREEDREEPLPEFADVKDTIRQILLRENYFNVVQESKKGVDIEILDENLKKQYEEAQPTVE
jgi:peptidyl-prolyl cis-trans isomerase C